MANILLEKKNGVATLTLNRPERLNSLTPKMVNEEIPAILDELAADDSVRVLVLTGAGRAFCTGGDVDELGQGAWGDRLSVRHRLLPVAFYILKLVNLGKPTIAAVNGVAAGGGFSLALACDFRIAVHGAKFVPAFLKVGTTPDAGISYFLPRLVGLNKALDILLNTDSVSASKAEAMGLVNHVVAEGSLVEQATLLANKLAKGPALAVALTRDALFRAGTNDLESQMRLETFYQNMCFSSEDFKEGVRAFLNKRAPAFGDCP